MSPTVVDISDSTANFEPARGVAVQRFAGGAVERSQDLVAEEVPVALEFNGISSVVMMMTPEYLEDFAYGYSLTEGVVDSTVDILGCDVESGSDGVRIAVTISSRCFARFKQHRRAMAGRTGCGICGVENLHQVRRFLPPVEKCMPFDRALLSSVLERLESDQVLFNKTGATHAACWVDLAGSIECVREDIGRHNAVDKLLGALSRSGVDFSKGALLTTSRASFEIVQKAAAVGVGNLVAISAPTAMAVRLAQELHVSLTGFMRRGSYVVYA